MPFSLMQIGEFSDPGAIIFHSMRRLVVGMDMILEATLERFTPLLTLNFLISFQEKKDEINYWPKVNPLLISTTLPPAHTLSTPNQKYFLQIYLIHEKAF
jgi:hypothetical protein